MISTAEVYLWGTKIGVIHKEEDKAYASFEYDRNFAGSGIELSPIMMPLSGRVFEFPDLAEGSFRGLPGLIADSLPDRFGNAVINRWLVSQGKTDDDFTVLDRLCYTGSRGMGALEFVPATGPGSDLSEEINVREMVAFASKVLHSREDLRETKIDEAGLEQLLKFGTSAGGARAKAIIAWNEDTNEIRSGQVDAGEGFDYWLMKFDGVNGNGDHDREDDPEYTLIEYAYYRMALAAGIAMNECRLYGEGERHHFMTKRFDRMNGKKLHMQTLGAIAHIDYNYPGLCSYEQAAGCMRRMNLPASDMEQLFRRMVFNVMAVNQDDQVKNISFLMDRDGIWRLAPAYDLTFSYDPSNLWLSSHQMLVNGKSAGITLQDMMESGRNMDISTTRCSRIISEVSAAVARWPQFAGECGIREKTVDMISKITAEAVRPPSPPRSAGPGSPGGPG